MQASIILSSRLRKVMIVLFAALIALSSIQTAQAQKGEGGLGGGGAGGGRGGGRGGRDEKKDKPRRNEQSAVDPATSRQKLLDSLQSALSKGTSNTPYLMNLFEQASTQAVPASMQSRKALADALSAAFKGRKLEATSAAAIAEPVSTAMNLDGISPEDLAGKTDPLKQALGAAGMSDELVPATLAAIDRVIADQRDEPIKKVSEDLEAVQKEGSAGDDVKSALATDLGALSEGANKPSEESLTKLSACLVKGLDAAQLTNREKAQLAFDFRRIFNSAGATAAEFNLLLNEVRTILKAGLVKPPDIQLVVAELQAIRKAGGAATAPAAASAPAESAAK